MRHPGDVRLDYTTGCLLSLVNCTFYSFQQEGDLHWPDFPGNFCEWPGTVGIYSASLWRMGNPDEQYF